MTPEEKMKVAELLASCNNAFSAKVIAEMYGLRVPKAHDNESIEKFLATTPKIVGRATSDVYQEYKSFCEVNSLRPRYIVQFVNHITTTNNVIAKLVSGKRTFVDGHPVVVDFLNDTPERLINGMVNFVVYDHYVKYCEEHNYHPISKIEFSKQICKFGGYQLIDKKIMGVKRRVFTK